MVRDSDGQYRFVGRLKDMIRRHGENISSCEVEETLLAHSAVKIAAVYAVQSALAEEEVMDAIVLHDGATVGFEELVRHCARHLPYFAVPRFLRSPTIFPPPKTARSQNSNCASRHRPRYLGLRKGRLPARSG